MGMTLEVITITVVASTLAAAVIVVSLAHFVLMLVERSRRRGAFTSFEKIDAEYRAARRAMFDAAGKSYRNLID